MHWCRDQSRRATEKRAKGRDTGPEQHHFRSPTYSSCIRSTVQAARLRAENNQHKKEKSVCTCMHTQKGTPSIRYKVHTDFSTLNRTSQESLRRCGRVRRSNYWSCHLPVPARQGTVTYEGKTCTTAGEFTWWRICDGSLSLSPNSFTLMRWNKHCSRARQTARASGVSPPISGGAPPATTAPMAPPACCDADCCRCRACSAANACAAFRRFLTSFARVAAR